MTTTTTTKRWAAENVGMRNVWCKPRDCKTARLALGRFRDHSKITCMEPTLGIPTRTCIGDWERRLPPGVAEWSGRRDRIMFFIRI